MGNIVSLQNSSLRIQVWVGQRVSAIVASTLGTLPGYCHFKANDEPIMKTIDERLREVIDVHFDPKWGSIFWLDRAESLGFDPRREIQTVSDLVRFGPTSTEPLATHSIEYMLPRKFHGRMNSCISCETGGTIGAPKRTVYLEEEFRDAFVEPFLNAAALMDFPRDLHWLYIGPSGPHETAETVIISYSLGSILAGMLTAAEHCDKVVAVAPPNAKAELQGFDVSATAKLFIAGTQDFAFNSESFQQDYLSYPEPKAFIEIKDADHFFRMEEERLYAAIAPFVFDGEEGTNRE